MIIAAVAIVVVVVVVAAAVAVLVAAMTILQFNKRIFTQTVLLLAQILPSIPLSCHILPPPFLIPPPPLPPSLLQRPTFLTVAQK